MNISIDSSKLEEQWLARLACLNVDRDKGDGKGCAPHKPLLLLSMMGMIADGHLKNSTLERSAELVFRFQNFWPIVEPRRGNRGDARMPFHALGPQRDGIWVATLTENGGQSAFRDTTKYVIVNPEFWHLLQGKRFRDKAASILIATYFTPSEQVALYLACSLPIPSEPSISTLKQQRAFFRKSLESGRSAKFRGQIITGYYFKCALTGYFLATSAGSFIVEAAHVRPLSRRGSNEAGNGLALTPNSHWMFDEGLWTIDDDFRVSVAGPAHFKDMATPNGISLRVHHGCELHFDHRAKLRPSQESLAYHREHIFLGS